jgi:hypothetical protein
MMLAAGRVSQRRQLEMRRLMLGRIRGEAHRDASSASTAANAIIEWAHRRAYTCLTPNSQLTIFALQVRATSPR